MGADSDICCCIHRIRNASMSMNDEWVEGDHGEPVMNVPERRPPMRVELDGIVYIYEGTAEHLAGHYDKGREPVVVEYARADRAVTCEIRNASMSMNDEWVCVICGHRSGRVGRWWHTYFAWRWWRPFDKSQPGKCLNRRDTA